MEPRQKIATYCGKTFLKYLIFYFNMEPRL